MNKRSLGRHGFSIVEVVVAMAVIAIVTASALTITLLSLSSEKKAVELSRAQYFAADALEAFRAAEDQSAFESAMEFAGGYSSFEKQGENTYIYKLENSGCTATVTVEYADTDRPAFSLTVTDGGGKEILKRSFRKGDAS